jgi:hypothetical protein
MRDTIDMAREAGDDWDSTLSTDKEFLKRFEALVRADERAAPVQEPVAFKVIRGELCYKSQDDDQSYGMWCPVTSQTSLPYVDGTEFYTDPPAAQQAVPEGWKLVPVELTNEMLAVCDEDVGSKIIDGPAFAVAVWMSFLAAAPEKGQQ